MNYPLADLLELAQLQELMESYYLATGINHALLDLDGAVLSAVGWQTICKPFHHAHPTTCQRCLVNQCEPWRPVAGRPYVGHRCGNGLFDYATPVVIDGEHAANIFIGQILHQPPDLARFQKQARRFGFDEQPYLDAIGRVPVIPIERLPGVMSFHSSLAQLLGRNGLTRRRQLTAEDALRQSNAQLTLRVQERTAELHEKNRLLLQQEDHLRQSHDLLSKLSAQVPGVLFQYRVLADGKAYFPYANQAMQEIYEISPEQAQDDAAVVRSFHHPDDAAMLMATLKESARTLQPWHCEYRVVLPKQGVRWRLGNARPEKLADNSILWHGFITDITESRQLQDELERQAHLDYLTGLANRRHFMEQAERELARALRHGGPLSVLMLDVDHFKHVNDSHGHKIGDLVLQKLSAVCRTILRDIDLIGRLGGEEFAILLPLADAGNALETAERLREALARAEVPLTAPMTLRFTVSIGVAQLASGQAGLDALLQQADHALYEAKRGGRNRVCLYRGE
jgi:diguanylate cyclase (GGDEF)-like protein